MLVFLPAIEKERKPAIPPCTVATCVMKKAGASTGCQLLMIVSSVPG